MQTSRFLYRTYLGYKWFNTTKRKKKRKWCETLLSCLKFRAIKQKYANTLLLAFSSTSTKPRSRIAYASYKIQSAETVWSVLLV